VKDTGQTNPTTLANAQQHGEVSDLLQSTARDPGATLKATKTHKSARTRSREFALQALYQLIVSNNEPIEIDLFTQELVGFKKADLSHYRAILHGCAAEREALDALITPLIDRPLSDISPIERAVMWLGVYELQHCLDVPWRVVLNESIELAKSFGGTDGHKYVNAVLNKVALTLRSSEINAGAQA
jgi:transcription antitermination protein NusB